ncbi:beta-N-acetylhexosaminidase [Haloechinothrix sp. YIM 98757]|uniref:Beta-N-acetylhexosaminidase n=1 Tax=Haloechinothrix aidingensis TaxID=2752311 RepID=A0A838AFA6_9PSEU|nr:beta-N-acetylhexosaminidase [Haloechinothrix aidingensis]MBA0127891.1 beta-N-acetylhexosaminidase [Haloechinothrix aidingensis]
MTITRRSTLQGLLAGGTLAAIPGWARAAEAPAQPWTIPAMRRWRPAPGSFHINSPARVVVTPREAEELSPTAETTAEDLEALLRIPARVLVTARPPRRGEVRLRLGAEDAVLGAEGYRMELGAAAVITANTAAGAFHGTRSLLQLLAQPGPVPAGVALDWPRYADRGLMVDVGRKHFSYEWLVARVHECAYLKLNYLHLWFTENLGWRIESERHPEIVSAEHLTKQQVRDLTELASRYHVTVVSGITMPGHMGAALAPHPEFQLRDVSGRANETALDFTIPQARQFAFDLVDEYLPLFPNQRWTISADEYLPAATYPLYPQLEEYARQRYGDSANAKDAVFGFVNDINAHVRAHGRTARVSNDDLDGGEAVAVDPDTVVEWWTDISPLSDPSPPTPAEILDSGHEIHNISWYPTYYSNLGFPLPPKPDLEGMYETWAVHRFRGPMYLHGDIGAPYHDIDPSEPRNSGSRLNVWNDDPEAETEQEIAEGIHPRLRVMAQQTWESPKLVPTYAEFEKIIDAVGEPPRT